MHVTSNLEKKKIIGIGGGQRIKPQEQWVKVAWIWQSQEIHILGLVILLANRLPFLPAAQVSAFTQCSAFCQFIWWSLSSPSLLLLPE